MNYENLIYNLFLYFVHFPLCQSTLSRFMKMLILPQNPTPPSQGPLTGNKENLYFYTMKRKCLYILIHTIDVK